MMGWVAGVDGCRGGWFVVLYGTRSRRTSHRVVERFPEILELAKKPAVVGVDIPIGLLEKAVKGGRQCDREARRLLRQPRARSVFSPPVRAALRSKDYEAANKANRASSPAGVGISKQSDGLRKKLLEVDKFMTPKRQRFVREVHPELCFYEMNNEKPMKHSKKERTGTGLAERRNLLLTVGFGQVISDSGTYPRSKLAKDDVLDACVACWTAFRISRGEAICIPDKSPRDRRGLRMEIWR